MDYLLRIVARIFFPKDGKAVTFRCVGCYGLGSLTSVRGKYGKKSELEDRRVILGNFPESLGNSGGIHAVSKWKKTESGNEGSSGLPAKAGRPDSASRGENRRRGRKAAFPPTGERTLDTCTARSGYLGPYVRRRARKTAKSHGEPSTGVTTRGCPNGGTHRGESSISFLGWTPTELKYLSKWGKEIKIRDSRSSDERNGKSPNQTSAKLRSVACLVLQGVSVR